MVARKECRCCTITCVLHSCCMCVSARVSSSSSSSLPSEPKALVLLIPLDLNMFLLGRPVTIVMSLGSTTGSSSICRRKLATWTIRASLLARRLSSLCPVCLSVCLSVCLFVYEGWALSQRLSCWWQLQLRTNIVAVGIDSYRGVRLQVAKDVIFCSTQHFSYGAIGWLLQKITTCSSTPQYVFVCLYVCLSAYLSYLACVLVMTLSNYSIFHS